MLPWIYRFYFWGVHGVFAEVVFTGIWEFVVSGDWRFMGVSSIWSFLVYGLGIFVLAEWSHNLMISLRVSLLQRCFIRTVLIMLLGLVCGMFHLEAQPWDYSQFTNIKGVIVMLCVWFFASLYFEGIMVAMKTVEPMPRWKHSGRLKIKEEGDRITIHYANDYGKSTITL